VNTLLIRSEGGVRHITLNRPDVRNAMSAEMVTELSEAMTDVASDTKSRAVVIRGSGGHFCAGGDLKSMIADGMKPPAPGEPDPIIAMNRAFGALLRQAEQLPQVLITICEGAVLGGGFGLACVSDVAFAHVDARFGMPETTRGLPPAQIAPFVVTRIGLTQARRLALTGAQFRGRDALRYGVVHEVFENEAALSALLDAELGTVRQCAPGANAMTKAIVMRVGKDDMDTVLDSAATQFAMAVRGTEATEGITAFMQKRKPRWAA
jgi:isohexenylglutaconyl-CoA hydratase